MLPGWRTLGLSIFGMLYALASAVAGLMAWDHGEELELQYTEAGLEYTCFALCGAPPMVILGIVLVLSAVATAPRPPDPPMTF